jgi:hypothetical protein
MREDGRMATDNDFYEDDEPVDKIVQRFEQGEKSVTAAPGRGNNAYLNLFGLLSPVRTDTANAANQELVDH